MVCLVSEWVDVMLIAFGAQLAVLPGEKVQLIIAGLSTRYNPYLIVAAAGSAFAGWTALEIVLGGAVRGALPEVYLDLITAGLFLFFAGMLYRSAPQSDNPDASTATDSEDRLDDEQTEDVGVGTELPTPAATFLGIFSMMALGEVGDKTQLVTISLAVQYGTTSAIWVGEMLAILPVSLVNALFFHRFAHRVNLRKAHYVGAALFLFFALDLLLSVGTGHSLWETFVQTVAQRLPALGVSL